MLRTIVRYLSVALLVGAMSGIALAADGPLLAYGARIAGDDARTRVVIEFDQAPDFFVHYVADPVRVIIDLPETSFGLKSEDMQARGLFSDIRYGAMGTGSSRIVLTAKEPVEVSLAEVKPDEDKKGFRLVLDSERVSKQEFAELIEAQKWTGSVVATKTGRVGATEPKADDGAFVVAVDAGHGGIDTGAIGTETKTEEKDVTLAFARDLVGHLNQQAGIKAFLTRDGDEFLSLPQRVQIARRKNANLFISLHADTLKQRDIRGATVYTISDKASDHLAASLAERENLSDAIAGVALSNEPAEVADILLDLTRRETQAFSVNLAQTVVSSFEGQINLINNPHRYAGFRVLQAPDVPSILLELGFLSNKEDEKLLVDPAWRAKVAELLAGAVRNYKSATLANGG
jgi:N-acetylmuramoyl-L-alanine amidase